MTKTEMEFFKGYLDELKQSIRDLWDSHNEQKEEAKDLKVAFTEFSSTVKAQQPVTRVTLADAIAKHSKDCQHKVQLSNATLVKLFIVMAILVFGGVEGLDALKLLAF